MKRKGCEIAVLGFIAAVVLLSARAEKAEEVQYRRRFVKGQVYRIHETMDREITSTEIRQRFIFKSEGESYTTREAIEYYSTICVDDVNEDGSAWVTITFDSVKFKQSGDEDPVEYDSLKDPFPTSHSAQFYAATIGESYSIKRTPEGLVLEVKGLEKLISNIEKKIPESEDKDGILDGIHIRFDPQAIKEKFVVISGIYPPRPVEIGESWNDTVLCSKFWGAISKDRYTLKDVKEGRAFLEVESVIEPDRKAGAVKNVGQSMMSFTSGSKHSQFEIELSNGMLLKEKSVMTWGIDMIDEYPDGQGATALYDE